MHNNITFAVGDALEVLGSRLSPGGSPVVIAREIKKGETTPPKPYTEAGLHARPVGSVMCGSTTKWFLRSASGVELKAQVLTGTFPGRGLPQGEVFLAWSDRSAVELADE